MNDNLTLNNKGIEKLKNTTILQFAQELNHVLNNDLIHEDTNIIEFINKYFQE